MITTLALLTIRALWHPDHRFRTGIETGRTSFYSYKGTVNSQQVSAGWLAAISYAQPLTNRIRLAVETRWLNPIVTRENDYSIQAQLLWRVFSW